MSWYYAESNERRGPIDDGTFQSLVAAGKVTPETLVWSEGMADWMPYGQVGSIAASPAAVPAIPATSVIGARSDVQPCRECGREFPVDEMISYDGRYVCASCKPTFFQKIREGAAVAGEREYAGFWIRFCAKFVDGILMNILGRLLGLAVAGVVTDADTALYVASGIGLIIGATYTIFFVGKYGATPGKMACKLQVIRADDSPMTYGRATGRYFAELLSAFTLSIGYLMAAFDPEKRALHDRICDTRVVRKR
jgi:uncharacterized RDD family membrane protein YckC